MKRLALTALLMLVATVFSMATGFRTVRLSEIARATALTPTALEGDADNLSFRSHPLRVCRNAAGDVSHIGYRIFSDNQLEHAAPRGLLLYLERYLLETDIPALSNRLVYAHELDVREGKLPMLFGINDATPIGLQKISRRMYRITFAFEDAQDLVLDVKCSSQVLIGADVVELEQIMARDLGRMPRTLLSAGWSGEPVTRISPDLLLCREGSFLNKDIRSDVYLEEPPGSVRKLFCNPRNPWRSIANIFLTGDTPQPVPLNLRVRCYEGEVDSLQVSLQQFVNFCSEEDCTLYFGIKSQEDGVIHATVFALSDVFSFCHLVSADISPSLPAHVAEGTPPEPVSCTLYPYIPLHYVDEGFFNIWE